MSRFLAAGRSFFLLLMMSGGLLTAHAQPAAEPAEVPPPPKRELRAMWIATVENIDWPNQRGETPEQYRREYRRLLDAGQQAGLNAVFVQIRPASDAFYKSNLEPWSRWLTGTQGKAPADGDDPLPFLITEAHRRGMEFHAWFNPYRASMDSVTRRLAPTHPFRQHPEWFLRFTGKLLYNPGLPEVRAHITRVILDVVRRYDIDAVHFDDYFYPYPEAGQVLHDEAAFRTYNPDSLKLGDWRRQNVNILIHDLHDSIQTAKRWVKFGISPFGVWMNKSKDFPQGSDTRAGQPSYSNLYADTRLWLEKGWIDYIVPQLYWSTNFRLCPYPVLVEWWSRNHFDRHLYIGHGTYRMFESTRSDTTWRNPRELPRQIRINRATEGEAVGSVFFSAKSVLRNPLHTTDSLRQDLFRYPALVPAMPWKDNVPPLPVANLTLRRTGPAVTLSWQSGPPAADGDAATYYVLYRFGANERSTPNDPSRILALPRPAPGYPATYVDTTAVPGQAYAYYVTAVDRLHNEGRPMRVISTGLQNVELAVGQSPAGTPRPSAPVSPPVAARPAQPVPSITLPSGESPDKAAPFTKVKIKEKPAKKKGFFGRLFGGRD
ncbi:glycoside hydrolase family 10 protein [Hymenobacter convexus]|uniref:glycoside hydrolase family 10 protein n=1 Tax=Hymenobacter sp. CA1UV-4 TaxID=3063782 RepID=UPI0027131196|nr:family 10 glycosylhydrolase [Hymenobacter sp. CA1UV-4]MDO7854321.1 family 10 glycosylhydrolase [Hymenobacter sp. CA1UV-4]